MKFKSNKFIIALIVIVLINYITAFSFFKDKSRTSDVSSKITKKVDIVGRCVGLRLYTKGVLVIGMSEVDSINGEKVEPYKNTGIQIGDMIQEMNGIKINNANDVSQIVNRSEGEEISIKYLRENNEIYTTITPVKTKDNNYLLGLWIRDAASGIGTLTFYDDENNRFAALGHGINDMDTGKLLNIANGELVTCKIVSIVKAREGKVGEIRGTIDEGHKVGDVEKNSDIGVYGNVIEKNFIDTIKIKQVDVASRNEVNVGKAEIYCELEENKVEKYEIEIKKLFKGNYKDNKSMLIKITDKRLLEKTGGIIPGMSGTPIIQNGKFVGAITNVLLNNPKQGYAIFADMMF
jgi:stage IV sporulation protein B